MSATLADVKEGLKAAAKRAFESFPPGVQEEITSRYAAVRARRKYGREFQACWDLVQRSQWLSPADLRALQAERLRALVAHAYATVHFYRTSFDERGVRPEDIRTPEDLEQLPLLTKQDVRRHGERLLSTAESRLRGHLIGTSGTTGTPLQFYWDHRREAMETALVLRHLGWAGFRRGDPKAALRGLEVHPDGRGRVTYWRYNRAENELHFSSSHLGEATVAAYLARLRAFRPAVLWGYPSSIHVLAELLERRGERAGLPLRGVFLSSEPVYDWQRELIESVFEARVFDWYGLSEGVVSAGECERHEGYHVSSESGIVEVIPSPEVPGVREVVATGLDNYLMPLIRYRTGDVGDWVGRPCSCGRGLPLLGRIETKMDDAVVTPDGRWVSPSVLTFPFKKLRGVAKSQIVQRSTREVVIRLVVDATFGREDEAHLVDGMRTRLGDGMDVRVEYVDDIPRTGAGKYRWVISDLGRARAGRPA